MPETGHSKFKSKVQNKRNEPIFGEIFTFEGVKGRHCELVVSVFSKSYFSGDTKVGQVTVPRVQVYGSSEREQVFPLLSSAGLTAGKEVGTIALKIIPT